MSGQLTMREYTNRDGEKRMSAEVKVSEIEFVSGGNREASQSGASEHSGSAPAPRSTAPASSAPRASSPETDDDMPF